MARLGVGEICLALAQLGGDRLDVVTWSPRRL